MSSLMEEPRTMKPKLLVIAFVFSLTTICATALSVKTSTTAQKAEQGNTPAEQKLEVTLPKVGEMINARPRGKGWINLLHSLDQWNAEKDFWQLTDGMLHGEYTGGKSHHYAWTTRIYKDFELNVLLKMTGAGANSGVCIRLHPTDPDNAPGYQVDMGEGYWGSLWEERRANMVQKFPDDLAKKLVKENDWNHYYIIAKGHHIQAWLNGVKTIDITHEAGFLDGAIGFQLCHGDKHTILDVKALYLKEL